MIDFFQSILRVVVLTALAIGLLVWAPTIIVLSTQVEREFEVALITVSDFGLLGSMILGAASLFLAVAPWSKNANQRLGKGGLLASFVWFIVAMGISV